MLFRSPKPGNSGRRCRKPRKGGSLERDKPAPAWSTPCRAAPGMVPRSRLRGSGQRRSSRGDPLHSRRAAAGRKSLEGQSPGGQRPPVRGSPRGRRWRILAESKALKARVYCCGSPGSPGGPRGRIQRHEGDRSREAAKALQGGEALEGEPQERYRHETRPEGCGRSKPSGARETLETEGVG